ncbi:MAG TPA: 4Fe-4S dicluster domain-containing protein, partial [Methanomassiliicoccales archaeon]|nr:4Fe-4S dicluster domain-containing protein [Methanomassiliicoccales archaeon]
MEGSVPSPRTGVFICTCGGSIALTIEMKELEDYARALEGVVHVENVDYLCHPEARERIASVVRGDHLDRVVVAACSPRLYLKEFQDTVATVGLAGCMVEMANIREQCAWVHSEEPIGATRKAKDLVSMAAAKLARVKTGEGGSISMVKPELCSGCGVCEATCRLSAIKMVPDAGRPGKRIATVLPKVCEGCGACVAACPAAAMDQACFS